MNEENYLEVALAAIIAAVEKARNEFLFRTPSEYFDKGNFFIMKTETGINLK